MNKSSEESVVFEVPEARSQLGRLKFSYMEGIDPVSVQLALGQHC